MVTGILSHIHRIRVNAVKNPCKITHIALAALVVFVVALVALAVNKSLKKHHNPEPPNEIQQLISQIKTNILRTTTQKDPHSYRKTILSIIEILLKENGIVEKKKGEDLFIYHTYQDYPYPLVAAIGGKDNFDKIPCLTLPDSAIKRGEKNSELLYLEISPNQMTHSMMKGALNGYLFLAVRYKDKCSSSQEVVVLHCRNGDNKHWYWNNSDTPETFSLDQYTRLYFIGSLVNKLHKQCQLC